MSSEENGNGNGLYKGMPWYVKAGMVFGVPTLLCGAILYMYASAMNRVMIEVSDSAKAAQKASEESVKESRGVLTAIRDHQDTSVKTLKVLEIMCRRMGKSDFEREVCER